MPIHITIVGRPDDPATDHYAIAARRRPEAFGEVTVLGDAKAFWLQRERPDLVVLAGEQADADASVGVALVRDAHVLSDRPFTWDRAVAERRYADALVRNRTLRVGLPARSALAIPELWQTVGRLRRVEVLQTVRELDVTPPPGALLLEPVFVDRLAQALSHLGSHGGGELHTRVYDGHRRVAMDLQFSDGRYVSIDTWRRDDGEDHMTLVGEQGDARAHFHDSAGPGWDGDVRLDGWANVWLIPALPACRDRVLEDTLRAIAGWAAPMPAQDDLLLRVIAAVSRSLDAHRTGGAPAAAVVEF